MDDQPRNATNEGPDRDTRKLPINLFLLLRRLDSKLHRQKNATQRKEIENGEGGVSKIMI